MRRKIADHARRARPWLAACGRCFVEIRAGRPDKSVAGGEFFQAREIRIGQKRPAEFNAVEPPPDETAEERFELVALPDEIRYRRMGPYRDASRTPHEPDRLLGRHLAPADVKRARILEILFEKIVLRRDPGDPLLVLRPLHNGRDDMRPSHDGIARFP